MILNNTETPFEKMDNQQLKDYIYEASSMSLNFEIR